jgi:hypothetical protein
MVVLALDADPALAGLALGFRRLRFAEKAETGHKFSPGFFDDELTDDVSLAA